MKMKKLIVFSIIGLLLSPMLSFVHSTKNKEFKTLIGDEVWFQIPSHNSSTSWVKAIEKPGSNKPKAMKNVIRFEENKVTYFNKNGVKLEYIRETEKNLSHIKASEEEKRTWKIPRPNSIPKDEDDFLATFQIFKKGVVFTFKDDGKSIIFSLK
jgi:protease II